MELSLKGQYPFRLGTTSFIFPADYTTNVRQLAPLVDEIELLLFESRNLPPVDEIGYLVESGREHGITYNVHLPMDIHLGGETKAIRNQAVDAVVRTLARVAPLSPTTHTLHLAFDHSDQLPGTVSRWQHRCVDSVTEVLRRSGISPDRISIETLDYDPFWLTAIVEALDLAVCVDVGHVILYGFDLRQVLDSFADRTSILHLHGVSDGRDHLALTQLDPSLGNTIAGYLQSFTGSASIEVFNLERLGESLAYFPSFMNLSSTETSL